MVLPLVIFVGIVVAVIALILGWLLFTALTTPPPAAGGGGVTAGGGVNATAPANVTGLALASSGVTTLAITFMAASTATSYKAQVRSGSSAVVGTGTFVDQASTTSGTTTTITGLTASTFYDIKIISVNSAGSSSGAILLSSSASPIETQVATSTTVDNGPVALGTAANYVIFAESGVSDAPTSAVTGNVGLYTAAAAYTGFSNFAEFSDNTYWTSSEVTGKMYAKDNAAPTPATLLQAQTDMQAAYTAAAGMTTTSGNTDLGGGTIGGNTLTAGVYTWSTALSITSSITLSGSATDTWVFQIAGTLTVASATSILLTGGAQAKNIVWQASLTVALGTTSVFNGVILCQTNISMAAGASITGKLYAQTAIALTSSTIVSS